MSTEKQYIIMDNESRYHYIVEWVTTFKLHPKGVEATNKGFYLEEFMRGIKKAQTFKIRSL